MASLRELSERGQSVWVDYLSRPMLRTGELAELVEAGVTGVTSNPTTFKKAIADAEAYDDQLRELIEAGSKPKDAFLALAQQDIREACELLRPAFDRGGADYQGWVSLEADPRLAYDTQASIDEAVHLHRLIDRPNLFVKIPGTEEGLPAIEEAIANGIPVNVTLLFSLSRHRAAAEAYLRGLRRLRDSGGDLTSVGSVASFFVSRVDAEADRRLAEANGPEDLRGTLAIANAKLAYQTYLEVFRGPEWEELAAAGARPQQCLWASTSTKDPQLRDVLYVEELIGPDTVNTMPRQTIADFRDHGTVADTVQTGLPEARRTLERFAEAGVDYDKVTAALEEDGVRQFAESFRELLDGIAVKQEALTRP
ncbi:transaldolase [Amycolatopsis aidingensis]|uniref:transaldolase n=1 Tax=Amycolatopsis aidingensis TaxID=2842453 RepID=UPI001C0C97E7|nr:transaldolase [Amycolatopsis aidingensis]